MAMEQSVAVEKFMTRIKQKCSERRLNREKQWPPCKSERLVRLELVEGEQRQGYSAGQTRGSGNKASKRTPIVYSDILKAKDDKKTVRKVLVEGDAGIGKTTLCTALSEDWANGKLFQEFEILLLLHLRQKRVASAGSLLGLLKLLHPSQEVCELVKKYIEEQEGKVLIIADGWDELSIDDRSEGSFLYELLFDECYSLSIIVTSRPYVSAPLRNLPCIDQLVEVHGFSKDNIKEFIQCEFASTSDRAKGSGLLEQLEGSPLIESVCSVPLNCAIICHLWHCFKGALPTTMSELYTKIILNVILRNIQKRPEYESIRSLSHFDALPESLQQPWSLLCEIAFQTLSEDKIVFSHDDLNREFQTLTLDSELLCFGLLQSAESILVDGHGVSFHFLHLTFQEYLAALYLARQPTDKQLQLFQSYARLERFIMVWRFFFGIIFTVCNQTINPDVLKCHLDTYSCGGHFYFDDYKTSSLCHLAFEANQRSVDALVASKIKDCRCVRFDVHSAPDYSGAVYVLANLCGCNDTMISINLSNCDLTDKQVAALAKALAGEHRELHLSEISLNGNKLSDQSVADLFDRALPAFSQSLQCIELQNNMIGPKTIKSVTTVLAKSLLVAAESDDYDEREVYSYTCLHLDDCPLGVDGVRALKDALCASKLANLQSLSLEGSLTDDADTNAELILALGSGHCHSLRELRLSRNNLGKPGGGALGKVLPHLHSGVILELKETQLGDKGTSAFAQNLQDTCKLGSLELENHDIHAAGISRLAESVCAGKILLSNAPTLSFANNPLGLGGAAAILKMLSSDHFLADNTCIHLFGCQLTTAGGSVTNPDCSNAVDVQQLICSRQLQATCTIYELMIDNNNFSGEGIHVLAAFMYVCPYVRHLFCQGCGITSDDLKQLLVLFSELRLKFSHLTTWSLGDNDIDDDGVSALIQHLSMFPKLNQVWLGGNIRVSPGILSTLKEKLDARRDSSGSDSSVDSSTNSEMTENEDYGKISSSHVEDSDTEEQCRAAEEAGITTVTPMDVSKLNVNVIKEPPPSKRVRTMGGEGVEQLQPTALGSEETTTTDELEACQNLTTNPENLSPDALHRTQSASARPVTEETRKETYMVGTDPVTDKSNLHYKQAKWSEIHLPSSLDNSLFHRKQESHLFCSGCNKIPVTLYRTNCDCKTLYCEACAIEVTGCTRHSDQEITLNEDESLKTKISKLKLQVCPNHQQGCKWEGGEVYRLRQHLSECAYCGKKKGPRYCSWWKSYAIIPAVMIPILFAFLAARIDLWSEKPVQEEHVIHYEISEQMNTKASSVEQNPLSCTFDKVQFSNITIIQDIKNLRQATEKIGNWQSLCENLGVDEGIMETLKFSNDHPVIKKSNCLKAYYDQGEATWEEVIIAIAQYPLKNVRLAKSIASEYLQEPNLTKILKVLESCISTSI